MKRAILTLAVLCGIGFGTAAQNVDTTLVGVRMIDVDLQRPSVVFKGTVIDSTNGAAIPFAKVNVRDRCYIYWVDTTDIKGYFEISMQAGVYDIEVAYNGFEHYWQRVKVTNAEPYTIKLQPKRHLFSGVKIVETDWDNVLEIEANAPTQKMEINGVKISTR